MHYDAWSVIIQQGAEDLGCHLSPSQVRAFYRHMRELRRWNRTINLTAITRPEEIAIKHFLDSIAPAEQIPAASRILDVGSGAGFPGLPLKIIRPASQLTLIDSSRKKINFLQQVIRQLGLAHADARHTRIEDFNPDGAHSARFDVIVSRAFTKAATLVRLAMPLVAKSGALLLWKGPHIEDEIRELQTIPELPGWEIQVYSYRLPQSQGERNLIAVKRI